MLCWLDSAPVGHASIEFAIWYHDVIYDPRSSMNESLSANFFHSGIGTRISPELASDIERLILATDHRSLLFQAEDESTIIDIDLSILGESEEVYDDYARNIRREYAHVPHAAYEEGRKTVLSGFLARTIFTNPPFQTLELVARKNILREIATLNIKECEQDAPSNR